MDLQTTNTQRRSAEYIAVLEFIALEAESGQSEGVWLFDAAPCSELDRISGGNGINEGAAPVKYLLLAANQMQWRHEAGRYVQISVSDQRSGDDGEIPAYEFSLGEEGESQPVISYYITIQSNQPSSKRIATLRQLAKFAHIPDAANLSAFEISAEEECAVAVYDVGQGSMSAIVDEAEHPSLFYDLGRPINIYARSLPPNFANIRPFSRSFDHESSPLPVILSHLDLDHWGYAIISGAAKWDPQLGAWCTIPNYRKEALERPWLMRRPNYRAHNLQPSHINFVQTLANTMVNGRSALYFWPRFAQRRTLGAITVFTCRVKRGTAVTPNFLRNNQGLGLLVQDRDSGARVLLTGDADYPSIPSFAKKRLSGIVAPHHGGEITKGSIPQAVAHGRMVFSSFPGCYPNIPHPLVETEARTHGWDLVYTSQRVPCFASNKKFECGHRLLRLGITPRCTCEAVPKACLCLR